MQPANNLRVYVEARAVTVQTYALAELLPPAEKFGLASQMRRAAVSIPANIAEGCGRNGNRALCAYLHIALGSACELQCLTEIAVDLRYLTSGQTEDFLRALGRTRARLLKLVTSLRGRPDTPGS